MKTTILDVLGLQQAVKNLMNDNNLTVKCKLDLVTLGEEVDRLLIPFNKIRMEIIKNNMTKDEEGNDVADKPAIEKEIIEAATSELDMSIESFTIITSENDDVITPQTLAIFKKFYGENFILETK